MDTNQDIKDSIMDKVKQKPMESKKFLSGLLGGGSILFVWAATMICMMLARDISGQLVNLTTITITAIGAIFTTICTGQAVIDFKTTAALQNIATTQTTDTNTTNTDNKNVDIKEHIIQEITEKELPVKPYSQLADKE